MIFNSENSLILRILIQTKCHKIPGSVLTYLTIHIFFRNREKFFALGIQRFNFGIQQQCYN